MRRTTFDLSGMSGGYEDMCQLMLWRGVLYLAEVQPPVTMWEQATEYQNVYGVMSTQGAGLKALEAAAIDQYAAAIDRRELPDNAMKAINLAIEQVLTGIDALKGCASHGYPMEGCSMCLVRGSAIDDVKRVLVALPAAPGGAKPVATMLGQPITEAERRRISKDGP